MCLAILKKEKNVCLTGNSSQELSNRSLICLSESIRRGPILSVCDMIEHCTSVWLMNNASNDDLRCQWIKAILIQRGDLGLEKQP